MNRNAPTDDHPSSGRGAGPIPRSVSWPLTRLLSMVRDRRQHNDEYVDWADVPDVPESPYRARLSPAAERSSRGVRVGESEVVRGEVTTVYEVRCPCGKRWFNVQPQHMQLCPRCNRVVRLDEAAAPTA